MDRQHHCTFARSHGAVLLGTLVLSVPVFAQSTQPPPADQELEAVVVSARRVSERLQETPASVTVLSSDTIEAAGARNFDDMALLVPNFQFTEGYRAGVPQISMRGIPNVQGGEAPVAFVIDGAQVAALDFVNQDLLDIANVQVLLGPQGGIYGRNALGGAVIIETKKPTDQFTDTLTVEGGNAGYLRVINTASGPLVTDKLWFKLTLGVHHFDGLIKNVDLHSPADWIRDYAGRLEILAKPTDSTTIDFVYSRTQGNEGIGYYANLTNYAVGNFKQFPVSYNYPSNDHRTLNTYVAKIDQETPLGTLTSISQYAETLSTVVEDVDWTPDPVALGTDPVAVKAFNQDLHLASRGDQSIQWILGTFYQWRRTANNLNVYYEQVPGGNLFCGCVGGPTDPASSIVVSNDLYKSIAWAAYGQATIRLPGNFKLNAALRYDSDRRSDVDLSIPAGPTNGISHTFGALQPSVSLQKQFTPDVMSYISFGKGFSSGGFNAYSDAALGGGAVQRLFPQETVLNYEVGIKSQFLDRRLTVNADVFHSDFSNEQYFLYLASPPARDIVTIRSVAYNGGELNVDYNLLRGLTFSANGGIAASRIKSNDPYQNDFHQRSPQANLYNTNVAVTYRRPVGSSGFNALYRVDYNYQGPICYDSANRYCFHSVGFLNARLGVENHRYTFAIWAKNIFSTREPLSFGPDTNGPGMSQQMVNQPATYGAQVVARF